MGDYNFDEKQGRLEVKLTLYLEMDLDNEQLETLFNNLDIEVKNNIVSDLEIEKIE